MGKRLLFTAHLLADEGFRVLSDPKWAVTPSCHRCGTKLELPREES